jgi:hypothetical protein
MVQNPDGRSFVIGLPPERLRSTFESAFQRLLKALSKPVERAMLGMTALSVALSYLRGLDAHL